MISEFSVQNYLSICSKQTISFEPTSDSFFEDEYCITVKEGVSLLKIGIIYGANASGKTNILKSLSFFKDLMTKIPEDKTKKVKVVPFLLDEKSRKDKTKMSMFFYLEGKKYILDIIFDDTRIYEETLVLYASKQPSKIYKRFYDEDTDSTIIDFGLKLELSKKGQDIIKGNTINNCSVVAAFGTSNVESSIFNVVYNFFNKGFDNNINPQLGSSRYITQQLNEDIKLKKFLVYFFKSSGFNIVDFELKEDEIVISPEMEKLIASSPLPNDAKQRMFQKGKITSEQLIFMHKTDDGIFKLPEDFESQGTMRFMSMAVLLYDLLKKNKFLTIDEIETSVHYDLVSYFIKVFIANGSNTSQLLLTTHDLNLLDKEFIRRDVVWFADQNAHGETILNRLPSYGVHKNKSLYNAYKQGKLGKLPFIGDLYLKDKD